MKYLTVVRHGKAVSREKYDSDFERPLARRGRKDAPRVARVLGRLRIPVDYIVFSPALRTGETAQLLATALEGKGYLHADERIYDASAAVLLDILCQVPDTAEHVVMVGHNPGLEDLVSGLCGGGTTRLNLRLPTAGMAHLGLEVFQWQQLRWGCGQLLLLVSPKALPR